MHLCICGSFSNRMMVSLTMFTPHLRASLGQRNFAPIAGEPCVTASD
jgi:hypothetical protein